MQAFENENTNALPISHRTVRLTFDCPKKCGAHCHLRLGFLVATYCKRYHGNMNYSLVVAGEKREGHWTGMDDNTEVFIDHDGKCDGHLEVELKAGGSLALWMTKKSTGLPATLDGRHITDKACFSFLCTGGDKDTPMTGFTSLNIAGLVRTMNVHGGVRRYFEIGNAFIEGGHKYSLFAEALQEKKPWIDFLGEQRPYGTWGSEKFDMAFTGAHECFGDLMKVKADRHVVMIVAKFYADKYLQLWRDHGSRIRWIGAASEWNKGMEEIKAVCIPGGVNTRYFTPLDLVRKFKAKEKRPIVAFYARMGDGRGVERILALAKRIEREADFIGFDTPGYPTIRQGLPKNVTIAMTPSQTALRDVLQRSDIVVSAMRSAGWNNVMAEGAACGCVPIATSAGTKDIILHGRTGFLCGATWFEKEAAEYIIELGRNPELMGRMARRANAWVQQFDWSIVVEKIISEAMK